MWPPHACGEQRPSRSWCMKRRLVSACPRRIDTSGWRGFASLDAPHWGVRSRGKHITRQYLAACIGAQSVE
eukprot:779350-Lingulodinium_polyedra.AAC.1